MYFFFYFCTISIRKNNWSKQSNGWLVELKIDRWLPWNWFFKIDWKFIIGMIHYIIWIGFKFKKKNTDVSDFGFLILDGWKYKPNDDNTYKKRMIGIMVVWLFVYQIEKLTMKKSFNGIAKFLLLLLFGLFVRCPMNNRQKKKPNNNNNKECCCCCC